jgi:hypothetical protein
MRVSLRDRINKKCRDCSYDELDVGGWRQQVERCEMPDCPLYPVRPTPRNSPTLAENDTVTV